MVRHAAGRPSRARRAGFTVAAIALSLLALEGTARILVSLHPRAAALAVYTSDYKLPDPVLGLRGNPAFPDHDPAGWRNASRPAKATVVAIGDSQTWSSETSRDDAWPQQAEAASGIPFYSMGVGGHGPVQYWRLLDEALALHPEQVVVAFYDGNDLYDVYRDVYLEDRAPEWRDATLAPELALLEELDPLHADWRQTRIARKAPGKARLVDALDWLQRHLATYALVRGTLAHAAGPPDAPVSEPRRDFDDYRERIRGSEPGLLVPFDDGARSTVFTPRGRLQALRPGDPRVEEALRITLALLDDMHRRCRIEGRDRTRLAVLLIPTKELVWAARVRERGTELHPAYADLVAGETALRDRVAAWLDARGIPWADALPELRASLAAGRSPYEMDWNGHPNPEGNAALARTALRLVQPR